MSNIADITSPSARAVGYGGIQINLTLTGIQDALNAFGSPGQNIVNATAPSPTLFAYGGAVSALTSPVPTVSATGTFMNDGTADLTVTGATLAITGTFGNHGTADLTLAPGGMDVTGYFGAVVSITIGSAPTVSASGSTVNSGNADLTLLPLYQYISASGHTENHGSANIVAPSATLGNTGRANLTAPTPLLVAIGHAVVAVSYEAYAVNLNHTPRQGVEPVDEMTHYTNYPFDRVVRYKNHYYGMNSTGLYLLEGPQDLTTDVAWNVRSCETDFGSVQQKTIDTAYFGGRMAPASTINLYAGEGAVQPYAYTTPRGALAQNYRQTFGRGIKARYYSFGFAGSGTLAIDTVTLNVTTLSRRI